MGLFGGALRTYALKSGDDGSFTSRQIFAHSNPHTDAGADQQLLRHTTGTYTKRRHSTLTAGVLCYILDGKPGKLQVGETVSIPSRHWHTFWSDPASGVDLDVNITVRGGSNPGFDETFVRNSYGYLSSCTMQNLTPNPIQMLTFMYSADVILELPLNWGDLPTMPWGTG
ncbi:hypothetical protein B0H14DRAFT_33884 [Mycena olivaceomarginata]|nr:hypothetical protein B0H14DRAFT_33884 [Mycena olivaceomarginata]